jgi:Secretion system C-terminal sorting domain
VIDAFQLVFNFDQAMDMDVAPVISFPNEDPTSTLSLSSNSEWLNPYAYQAKYNMDLDLIELADIDVMIEGATDANGNAVVAYTNEDFFDINTTISVNEQIELSDVLIYPNPAFGGQTFQIRWNANAVSNLTLINSLGQIIRTENNLAAGQQIITIDTNDLAAGMYLVQIFDGSSSISKSVQVIK